MKNKLPAYACCLTLLALARIQAAPTDGFVQYTDTFTLQKPYDLNISDRFSATDAEGLLQYNCWINSGDHPLYITSGTAPRTEMRWNTNWTATERIWEADVMIDSGSEGTAIQQIKSNSGFEPIYINVHNNGNLYNDGGSTVLASGMFGKWFHLMCAYNPQTGIGRAWINGNLVVTRSDPHPANTVWYFKNGTYGTKGFSRTHFQNVKFWSHDQTGLVQAPSYRPLDATYSNDQLITIYSRTPGASIRYTTDGSTPTATTGTLYAGPFMLPTGKTTVSAIAFKSGMTTSSVSSSAYNILSATLQVADPAYSVETGVYGGTQSVTITSATSGASIRYTTDGSIPSETHGTLYAGNPVSIGSSDTTLQAIAYKSGQVDSRVSYAFYLINSSQVADPTFNPAAGTYSSAQTVSITSATSGASIRYTTDGSTPSETAGTVYSSAITLNATTTLKAIAYKSGSSDSSVATAVYTINLPPPQVAAPTFSPGAGTYTSGQTVSISTTTAGASIRYTTDGSTPSETVGTLYSVPVSISATTTLKAIAYKAGFTDSTVTSATYTFGPPPTLNFEAESLSPVGNGATVSISNDANASGGVLEFLNSTAAGQTITFTTPSIPAGTYQVQLRYKTNTTRGQHTVKIDGTQVGGTLDQYATTQAYQSKTFGNVTFASAGTHSIVLTVTGKNSAATQFYLTADKFTFVGQ